MRFLLFFAAFFVGKLCTHHLGAPEYITFPVALIAALVVAHVLFDRKHTSRADAALLTVAAVVVGLGIEYFGW